MIKLSLAFTVTKETQGRKVYLYFSAHGPLTKVRPINTM